MMDLIVLAPYQLCNYYLIEFLIDLTVEWKQ
jgi:hypothetical protein